VYRRLRAEEPVHWCEPWGQWVITRYPDVLAVIRDPARFSSAGFEQRYIEGLPAAARAELPDLLRHYSTALISNTDPPVHTRMRRIVARSFSPRVLEAMRGRVEELVEGLLDRVEPAGRMDAIADFAYPLPAMVIADLLGAPAEGREQFLHWSADIVAFVGSGRVDLELARRADQSLREFRAALAPLLEERRRRPADDLVGLLAASGAEGKRLSDDRQRAAGALPQPGRARPAARRPGARRAGRRGAAPLRRSGAAGAARRDRRRRGGREAAPPRRAGRGLHRLREP
jgi:cytochrome P450